MAPRIINRLRDSQLAVLLDSACDGLEPSEDLVVVDSFSSAQSARCGHILISTDFPTIMRVMKDCYPHGVLHPRDLNREHLSSLAAGLHSFTVYTAADLDLKRWLFDALRLLVHGASQEEASLEVGLSVRTLRRHLTRLTKAARVDPPYPWPMLSPIFPR